MDSVAAPGLAAIARLVPLYLLVAVFWSLYDQTGGAWVQQAERMDRRFLGIDWLSSQIQAINPLLVLLFMPRGLTLDPKKKTVIVADKYKNSVMTFSLPEIYDRPATSQIAREPACGSYAPSMTPRKSSSSNRGATRTIPRKAIIGEPPAATMFGGAPA